MADIARNTALNIGYRYAHQGGLPKYPVETAWRSLVMWDIHDRERNILAMVENIRLFHTGEAALK